MYRVKVELSTGELFLHPPHVVAELVLARDLLLFRDLTIFLKSFGISLSNPALTWCSLGKAAALTPGWFSAKTTASSFEQQL